MFAVRLPDTTNFNPHGGSIVDFDLLAHQIGRWFASMVDQAGVEHPLSSRCRDSLASSALIYDSPTHLIVQCSSGPTRRTISIPCIWITHGASCTSSLLARSGFGCIVQMRVWPLKHPRLLHLFLSKPRRCSRPRTAMTPLLQTQEMQPTVLSASRTVLVLVS